MTAQNIKTEAQMIRDQASLIGEEELKQIRINALDEMWNLKKQALDMESKSFWEKTMVYVKAFSYEIYIRTFGFYFRYPEYIQHEYKWRLYREMKSRKVRIPQPQNYIPREKNYPIDNTVGQDEADEEKRDDEKYPE